MAYGRFVGLLLCAAWLAGDLTPVSGQAYLSDRYSSAPVAPQNAGRVFGNPASVSSRMNEGLPSASYGDYRLNPAGHSLMSGNDVGVASSSCDPVDPCENGLGDPYDPSGLFPRRAVRQCLNADCPTSRLTFRKGAIFLHRSRPSSQAFTDGATPTNAHDLDPGYQAGPQADLIWRNLFLSNYDLQGTFFHTSGFGDTAFTPVASQLLTTPPINFAPMDVTTFFNSSVSSGELNLRRRWSPWFTTVNGIRYFDLQEELFHKICATGMTERIRTSNHAYGFQSGAEAIFFRSCRMEVGGWAKFAALNNAVDQHTTLTLIPGALPSFADSGNRIALLGDLGLFTTVRLFCWLSVRGGYQTLWFDGAATAAPQMLTSNINTAAGSVASNSNLFFHGGFANVEISW